MPSFQRQPPPPPILTTPMIGVADPSSPGGYAWETLGVSTVISLQGEVDPTGVSPADNTINAAIASHPGYDILLPPNPSGGQASYKCNNPIVIGNGTANAASTVNGTRLILPGKAGLGIAAPQARLFAGTALAQLVVIQGPCYGNGLINAFLDPNNNMTGGTVLTVTSGQAADFDGLVVKVPSGGIGISEGVVGGAVANQNSMHNMWRRIVLTFSDANTCTAWVFGGAAAANACYERIDDVYVAWVAAANAQTVTAFDFAGCDNVRLRHVHCNGYVAGSGTNRGCLFDYSVNSNKPADCFIDTCDWGSASTVFANNGVPGGAAKPNRIVGISATNGQPANPTLANLDWGYSNSSP